jgi:hypothetical protein
MTSTVVNWDLFTILDSYAASDDGALENQKFTSKNTIDLCSNSL